MFSVGERLRGQAAGSAREGSGHLCGTFGFHLYTQKCQDKGSLGFPVDQMEAAQ